jgi:hypothetical protein
MAAGWSKAVALSRLQRNRVLQQALHVEPRLPALLGRVIQPPEPGYQRQRDQLYPMLRLQSHYLVRSGANNPQLPALIYGHALLLALDDRPPPEEWDSAHTGRPE